MLIFEERASATTANKREVQVALVSDVIMLVMLCKVRGRAIMRISFLSVHFSLL